MLIGSCSGDEDEREAEENRKEKLLASTQSLQPNFNRSNVTEHYYRSYTRDSGAAEDGVSSKKLKESSTLEELHHHHHHHHKTEVTVPKRPQKLYGGLIPRKGGKGKPTCIG
ncbi:hypothetical protein DY000_02000654 [Brassica cretica]|uniref:Uncharacterized protein n=1 Tax=Brassica cretica TaxID=69181 RepID=A0ABQ7BTR4_BRACR|nr:hypothetical protein DY000_02000654 [Brassica cretica]